LAIATIFINRAVIAKARKINTIYARKRTIVYKNTHQKNTSVLRKYIRHNLTQTKIIITTLRTNTDNI
jgi:hypothetical protein